MGRFKFDAPLLAAGYLTELDHAVVFMSKGDLSTEIAYEGEGELGVFAESPGKALDMLITHRLLRLREWKSASSLREG